jgi:hypothetical protein
LIHKDAIKKHLVSVNLNKEQINYVYASEADLLNVALFGKRASEWKKENMHLKLGSILCLVAIIFVAIVLFPTLEEEKKAENQRILLRRLSH